MARMHARRKGRSSSTKPFRTAKPKWLEVDRKETMDLIVELYHKGYTTSQIGIELRDVHGIPDVNTALGLSMYDILEQRGELHGIALGPASDVYSFGVMLYLLLTGRRPTGRKGVADLVTGLSQGWDVIIDRCIEYQPQDRYEDGTQLLAALKACTAGQQRTTSRSLRLLASLLLLGGIVAFAYWTWKDRDADSGLGDRLMVHPNQGLTVPPKVGEDQSSRALPAQQPEEKQIGEPAQRQQGTEGPEPGAQASAGQARTEDIQQPSDSGQRVDSDPVTPVVQRDLIVIVNCEDTMLLDMAQSLLSTGLQPTGLSVEYLGDSQKASGTELRAKHAKLLAQHACPFIIAKVQAVDESRDIRGATVPFSTVSLNLNLFDPGRGSPKTTVTKQEPRGSQSLAKARKDALDLAMAQAIEEMLHALE